jgi:hypothetical protein
MTEVDTSFEVRTGAMTCPHGWDQFLSPGSPAKGSPLDAGAREPPAAYEVCDGDGSASEHSADGADGVGKDCPPGIEGMMLPMRFATEVAAPPMDRKADATWLEVICRPSLIAVWFPSSRGLVGGSVRARHATDWLCRGGGRVRRVLAAGCGARCPKNLDPPQ